MSITLENRERRMQVFNLPHAIYCAAAGRCQCTEQVVTTLAEDARTGARTPRSVVRRIPASLTLLARAQQAGLPRAVLEVPEIQRAVAAGALRVWTEPAAAAAATATATAAATAADKKQRGAQAKE